MLEKNIVRKYNFSVERFIKSLKCNIKRISQHSCQPFKYMLMH